jgi:hypothetical protein
MGHEKRRRLKYLKKIMGNYATKIEQRRVLPVLAVEPHTAAGRKAKYEGIIYDALKPYVIKELASIILAYVPDEVEMARACVIEQMSWGRTAMRMINAHGVRSFGRRALPGQAQNQDLELESKIISVFDDMPRYDPEYLPGAIQNLEARRRCPEHRGLCDPHDCIPHARWLNNCINGKCRKTGYIRHYSGTRATDRLREEERERHLYIKYEMKARREALRDTGKYD